MSVDTYLKGKDTRDYLRMDAEGVEVLVAPVIAQLSERVSVSVGGWLGRRLTVEVEHEHGPACRH